MRSGVCSTTKRRITSAVATALLQSLWGVCSALSSSDLESTEAAANSHTLKYYDVQKRAHKHINAHMQR